MTTSSSTLAAMAIGDGAVCGRDMVTDIATKTTPSFFKFAFSTHRDTHLPVVGKKIYIHVVNRCLPLVVINYH